MGFVFMRRRFLGGSFVKFLVFLFLFFLGFVLFHLFSGGLADKHIDVVFSPFNSSLSINPLYCAFYDVDFGILNLSGSAVVVDKGNFRGVGVPDDVRGTVHEKFCLLPEHTVFVGSGNPTKNGFFRNNNDFLFIKSDCLYDKFFLEFLSLKKNSFPARRFFLRPCDKDFVEGNSVEVLFCPEEDCYGRVFDILSSANSSIHFLLFSFTLRSFAELLRNKSSDGVDVKGVLEKTQTFYSVRPLLSGLFVDDVNRGMLHHKLFIVDSEVVITGSANPSNNGFFRNQEVLVIIRGPLALKYEDYFFKIWNITVS